MKRKSTSITAAYIAQIGGSTIACGTKPIEPKLVSLVAFLRRGSGDVSMIKIKVSAVAAIFAACAALIPCAAEAASTVVQYRFNSDPGGPVKDGSPVTGDVDSGPNHLNGSAVGSLSYSSNVPKGGKPLSLNTISDSNSYIGTPDAPPLDPTGGFTISVWAQQTGTEDGDGTGDAVVTKTWNTPLVVLGGCQVSYVIEQAGSTGHITATVCDVNQNPVSVYSTDSFGDHLWHHIVMKYAYSKTKSATVTLTVDGRHEGKTTVKNFAGVHYGPGDLAVGECNITTADYRRHFVGYIDELKITAQ